MSRNIDNSYFKKCPQCGKMSVRCERIDRNTRRLWCTNSKPSRFSSRVCDYEEEVSTNSYSWLIWVIAVFILVSAFSS